MIRINILKEGHRTCQLTPQIDIKKYPIQKYYIKENSDEDIVWDYVVVYENFDHHPLIRYRAGGLVFIAGEPPLMRPYPEEFLNQFDIVVIPNKKIQHKHHIQSHGYLPWSLGLGHFSKRNRYTYDDLESISPKKEKGISIVTSSKAMMPGHVKRIKLIERLKKDFPGQIDYYGFGFTPIDYKADALLPYFFHICLENCYEDDYWTEKFADPVLAMTVPVYSGCPNISNYFDGGYIEFDINDYNSLRRIVNNIVNSPEIEYNKYKIKLKETKKALMERENLIPFIISLATKNTTGKDKDIMCATLKHPNECKWYKVMNSIIRIKRFVKRLQINLEFNG